MKRVIVPDGDDFYCNICVDKPRMQRKNVFRHLVESVTHSNSISKQVDTEGHNELIPKIQEALAKNKRTYNKKSFNTKEEKKDYLKFLIFCQKQNFSFQQISSLGKFLHEMAREKRLRFFEESTFHREEISSVARCFGKCILKNLENDLKNSPYSFTIDSSTVSRRNISALKVKYLKEDFDEQGIRRTTMQNRTIGIKYLKHSTTAKTMYDITNEKLLGLSEEIKSNLVGYVHDHASNLSGIYNGLGALLKSNLKQQIMDLKDPCHSINLTLYQSIEILPSQIIKFIKKVHNHFISPQRVAYLHNVQLNNNMKVLSPIHYVKTRWLTLGQSLDRLIELWESLKLYMNLKPKFQGVTNAHYHNFSKLLDDDNFKLKILFVAGIVKKLNEMS